MDTFIQSSVQHFQSDLLVKCEVYNVMRDLVDIVANHDLHNALLRSQSNYQCAESINHTLVERIKYLEKKNAVIQKELLTVKDQAKNVREKFVSEIGHFLSENKLNKTLKDRIAELENKLSRATFEKDGNEEDETSNSSEQDGKSTTNATTEHETEATVAKEVANKPPMLLLDMPEPCLLHIFSFLETAEVLNYAQVCRYVYRRVDIIFCTDSSIVKPEWAVINEELYRNPTKTQVTEKSQGNPTVAATNVNAIATASSTASNEFRLSREMVDVLTKRLNAQEMKVILGIAEKLKKQVTLTDALNAEKEDLTAKLQNAESVKDFLIEKLKTAELAIKSMMNEVSTLKKQTSSDNEIITYLDLSVQDLEGRIVELTHRSNHLQASLDLQVGTHSLKEEQLTAELNDYKLKYEKLDANFKSQKKLLVKEVKSLRSQLETLTVERDQHASRFQLLKDALTASDNKHSSNSSSTTSSIGSSAYIGFRKF